MMALISFLALLILISNHDITYAQHPDKDSSTECRTALFIATFEKVAKDFSELRGWKVSLQSYNDLSCRPLDMGDGKPAYMANVIITVLPPAPQYKHYFYGVFHIHFSPDGRWIPTAGSTIYPWKTSDEGGTWNFEWCDFIRSVYPTELKQQGCVD